MNLVQGYRLFRQYGNPVLLSAKKGLLFRLGFRQRIYP